MESRTIRCIDCYRKLTVNDKVCVCGLPREESLKKILRDNKEVDDLIREMESPYLEKREETKELEEKLDYLLASDILLETKLNSILEVQEKTLLEANKIISLKQESYTVANYTKVLLDEFNPPHYELVAAIFRTSYEKRIFEDNRFNSFIIYEESKPNRINHDALYEYLSEGKPSAINRLKRFRSILNGLSHGDKEVIDQFDKSYNTHYSKVDFFVTVYNTYLEYGIIERKFDYFKRK